MDIPEKVTQQPQDEALPPIVSELPQDSEPTEALPYKITFHEYKHKECGIDNLQGNKGRKILKTLKDIGSKIKSYDDFKRNNIKVFPIEKKDDYSRLYKKLSDDIELREIKYGSNPERVFFFTVEPEKLFCIVAIKHNHLETKKNKK